MRKTACGTKRSLRRRSSAVEYSQFQAVSNRLLSADSQIVGRVPRVGGQRFCPHSRPISLFSGWETENDELRLNISPAFDEGFPPMMPVVALSCF